MTPADSPNLDPQAPAPLSGDALDQALAQWVECDRSQFDGTVAIQALRQRMIVEDGQASQKDLSYRRYREGSVLEKRTLLESRVLGKQTLRRVIAITACMASAIALVYRDDISFNARSHATTYRYTTTTGQQKTLQLPDGSLMTLAPQTHAVVSADFGKESRTLELDGQAYFEVHQATGVPFVVRAGAITVRVLGTTFNVRRYSGDSSARVDVLSGKVTANNLRRAITLTEGQAVQLTDSAVTAPPTENGPYVNWTHGELVFDGAPVYTVLTTLSRWYGYQFRFADSTIAQQHIKVKFSTKDREETLRILKSVLDVSLTFDGPVITLHSLKRGTSMPRYRDIPQSASPLSEIGK